MSEKENKIDFLAVGDIVIDAFIKLKDAHVHCKIDTDACELCVRFGDKVPYESVTVVPAVGNGPNAAVSARRLGLTSAIVTHIGDDKHGADCLESLKNDEIITTYVEKEKDKPTNYHYVLWYDVDRTILVKHTEFDYKFPNIPKASWIYLTSLASNTLPYEEEIAEYLKNHPETKLAFQPGTFQIKLGAEKLKDIYKRTEIFFCNVEEAEKILNIETKDIPTLIKGIHALGPKIVSISDGPNGAYAYDGANIYFQPAWPDQKPAYDRTGAGDAFASTTTAAIALGLDLPMALKWAAINAMSVVQQLGAQKGLLSRTQIEDYLKSAKPEFETKVLN